MSPIDEIKKLTSELLHHCHLYYDLDTPEISDAEYDKKFDALKKLEDEAGFWLANSPTRKVQGEILPFLEKCKHSIPMLSADKSTDMKDVLKFVNEREVVTSFKLDGATVVLKYDNHKLTQALTRGSGYEGEIITCAAKMIKNLPDTIPYGGYVEIRGEALIPWKYYNEMNSDGSMGHPRNVASGGLRQLNANETAKRNIYFYAFTLVNWKDLGVSTKMESLKFLSDNGFDVVPHMRCVGSKQTHDTIIALDRERYENPTDGWIVEFNDLSYGESLGSTGHHDRKMFALKPQAEEYETYFRGIEYKTCRTGVVSMTALFDPVEIGNTTVSRATLHNCDFFNSLELGEDDLITITKFNEIIPGIIDNQTRSGTYKLIDKCPSCGETLIIKNTGTANVLYCPNESCTSRKLAQLVHFVSKNCMDIQGLSEATLEKFISLGYINDFNSVYHLSEHKKKLILLSGFGARSIEKLLVSIEKSRDVKLENFIAALGIPNIGLSAAKTISSYFKGDYNRFMDAYVDSFEWTKLDDFGMIMAKSLEAYLNENARSIQELAKEVRFITDEPLKASNNPFTGKSICVTGKLTNFTRDSINEKITAIGAKVANSVSKKTDYLITNESSGSSKYKKAVELNISIITENEFITMIGE
jgi:DNA ligase (NAD+)